MLSGTCSDACAHCPTGTLRVPGECADTAPASQSAEFKPEAWGVFHGGCLLGICRPEMNLARAAQYWVLREVSKLVPGFDGLVREACFWVPGPGGAAF